jgi:hypothetical protein
LPLPVLREVKIRPHSGENHFIERKSASHLSLLLSSPAVLNPNLGNRSMAAATAATSTDIGRCMKIRGGLISLVALAILLTPGSAFAAGATAVGAQDYHTCAVTMVGGVKCWGLNNFGQLGDGTTTSSSVPVDVTGLATTGADVGTGNNSSCALTTGGGIKCWGNNGQARLGDGMNTNSSVPVDVSGLNSGATDIAVGGTHACALTTGGGLKCWGANSLGGLGDGTTRQQCAGVRPRAGQRGYRRGIGMEPHLRGHIWVCAEVLGLKRRGPAGRWNQSQQFVAAHGGRVRRVQR